MNAKEFEKTIQFEELAKTEDSYKFMLKSYLVILLRGGKLWENCYLYSCGKISPEFTTEGYILGEGKPLKFNNLPTKNLIAERKKALTEFFETVKKEGYWTTEHTEIKLYDADGEETGEMGGRSSNQISRKDEIITKTTFFMDKKRDIRPLTPVTSKLPKQK